MSHFRCTCGHRINDQTDFLPYKAHFLPDEDTEAPLENGVNIVVGYIEARERGEEEQFLNEHKHWLKSRDLREIVNSLLQPPAFYYGRNMYECEECGRIWMEAKAHANRFESYLPESDARGVLRSDGVRDN
ncbi:MAG: hypothetical protein ACRDHP_07230 [Ktedonobacterales bacterium]